MKTKLEAVENELEILNEKSNNEYNQIMFGKQYLLPFKENVFQR